MMAGWFVVVLLLLHIVHNYVLKQTIITGNTSCCVVHKDDMYCKGIISISIIRFYHITLSLSMYFQLSIYNLSSTHTNQALSHLIRSDKVIDI